MKAYTYIYIYVYIDVYIYTDIYTTYAPYISMCSYKYIYGIKAPNCLKDAFYLHMMDTGLAGIKLTSARISKVS